MKTPEQIENERLAPAQPQAPAEPWRSFNGKLTLPELLRCAAVAVASGGALESDLMAAVGYFREHPPEAADPLREERDRLAERVKALEGHLRAVIRESDRNTDAYVAAPATPTKEG